MKSNHCVLDVNPIWIFFLLLSWQLVGCNQKSDQYKPSSAVLDSLKDEEFKRLEKLYWVGDYTRCIAETNTFLTSYPNHSFGWSLLSSACMTFRNDSLDSLAFIYLEKGLMFDNTNHIALLNKAILLDKEQKYSEAYQFYMDVIELKPGFAQVYSNLAGNRLKVKDYKSAIEYGEKAVILANQPQDKGVLCYSYHLAKDFRKRDSLLLVLQKEEYSHIQDLIRIFEKRKKPL